MKKDISKALKHWIEINLNNGIPKAEIFNALLQKGYAYNVIKKELNYEPTLKQNLSDEWQDWIFENLENGISKDELAEILFANGFSYDCIKSALGLSLTKLNKNINYFPKTEFLPTVDQDHLPTKNTSISTTLSSLPHVKKLDNEKIELFMIENFLSKSECESIINLLHTQLKPSTLSSYEKDRKFRTSKTCNLNALNNNLVEKIDSRICKTLDIDQSFSEPIQGQYYEEGDEFKPHTDFFEKEELSIKDVGYNQRTYTVMVYLNNTARGGETYFPKIKKIFSPTAGMAVIWNNLDENGVTNSNTLHQAKPVKKGYKAILTKWFRQRSRNVSLKI